MSKPGISTDQWLAAAKYRRTVYGLKDTSSVSDARIEEIVKEVLSFTPSSYNTQPEKLTIILGEKHKAMWDAVIDIAKPMLGGSWDHMSGFFQGCRNAYGSVIFWVDADRIKASQEENPHAAHMMPQYSEHSSGIAQILVWTALELEGLGANLQHMQALPGAEDAIRKIAGVPEGYSLKAHLNFGDKSEAHPAIKDKFGDRLKVVK